MTHIKFCKVCGERYPIEVMFCKNCGSFLVNEKFVLNINHENEIKVKQENEAIRKKKRERINTVREEKLEEEAKIKFERVRELRQRREREVRSFFTEEKIEIKEKLLKKDQEGIKKDLTNISNKKEKEKHSNLGIDSFNGLLKEGEDNKVFVTRKGICYLTLYIPDDIRLCSDKPLSDEFNKYIEYSERILDYKNDKCNLTNELMEGILHICKHCLKDLNDISLVSIPSSKESNVKDPQTKKSIIEIMGWYKEGIIESKFNCNKKFYNESELLNRIEEIEPRKKTSPKERCDGSVHQKSIECSKEELSESMGFIILDDITTSGTSMIECKKILVNNGAKEENIICLAIGETIDKYNYDLRPRNGKYVLTKKFKGF